jgi:hypothetical protein
MLAAGLFGITHCGSDGKGLAVLDVQSAARLEWVRTIRVRVAGTDRDFANVRLTAPNTPTRVGLYGPEGADFAENAIVQAIDIGGCVVAEATEVKLRAAPGEVSAAVLVDLQAVAPRRCEDERVAACSLRAEALCNKLDECSGGFQSRYRYGSFEECIIGEQRSCVLLSMAPGTTGEQTTEPIARCAAALPALRCEDLYTFSSTFAACKDQRKGRLPVESGCVTDDQCQSEFCQLDPTLMCGRCKPRKNLGETCAVAACDPGLLCTGAAANPICTSATGKVGAACGLTPCTPNLACVNGTIADEGVCSVPADEGETCDPRAISAPPCKEHLWCNQMTLLCERPKFTEATGACGIEDDGSVTICAAAGNCRVVPNTARGQCEPVRTVGDACDTTSIGCTWPARCATDGRSTTGVCSIPDADSCAGGE